MLRGAPAAGEVLDVRLDARRILPIGRRASCGLVVVSLSLIVLVGCGASLQDRPAPVPADRLPSTAPGEAPAGPPAGSARGLLYLISGDNLEPVLFGLESTDVAGRVRALLGVTKVPQNLRTAVPEGTRLEAVAQQGSTVTLRLSDQILQARGSDQQLVMAQLVYTATEAPGVTGIRLSVNGRIISLPDREGRLTQRPLTRRDVTGPKD